MAEPIWLSVARAFVGTTEQVGPGSNPVILQWAQDLRVPYTGDDTAWCGLSLNRVLMACQLPLSGKGYDLLRAKSFESWGVPLPQAVPGAVLVFTREGGGHVGIYTAEDATHYVVLGGNQSDKVGYARIDKARLTAVRWPAGVALPTSAPLIVGQSTSVQTSTNEA